MGVRVPLSAPFISMTDLGAGSACSRHPITPCDSACPCHQACRCEVQTISVTVVLTSDNSAARAGGTASSFPNLMVKACEEAAAATNSIARRWAHLRES